MERVFVSGLDYRSASVEVRERLALTPGQIAEILDELQSDGRPAEVMLVSTCNRVEVWGVAGAAEADARLVFDRLCGRRGVPPETVRPRVSTQTGRAAVRHCFRVTASLESMIVGESQILGQVKEAFGLAQRCGTVGPLLHQVVTQAFAAAKKARSETEIGKHAVSVSFAAVELAKKIFGDLSATGALLIGAGEMGELAARHLVDQGVARLYVANRTWSRALELASALRAVPVALERRRELLAEVDIVIVATGAAETLLTRDAVAGAVGARASSRPLFIIDIAVPRNVDPRVDELANVFCYDVDDLQQVVDANLKERRREAARAEAIVERDVDAFLTRFRDRDAVPAIASLREKAEAIRRDEVARTLARLGTASPETRQAIEAMSSALVNKILHTPTVRLRESARTDAGAAWPRLVAELFALEPAAAKAEWSA